MHKLRVVRPAALALVGSLFCPALTGVAHAQAPAAPPAPAPASAEPPPPPPTASPPKEPVVKAPSAPDAGELARLRAEVEETKRAVADLKAAQEEAAAAAPDEPVTEQEKLKIYGFADVGFQYVQINKQSFLANVYDVNEPDFVLGNLNLYFDAQPVENWRSLIEVRFTNAPQGKITSYGGLGGKFSRASTLTDDSTGAALNAPLWGGSVVIERAWLEYNRLQAVKIRVGNWFSPFGIWN